MNRVVKSLCILNLFQVAGWGLTAENGKESQILKVLDVPYVSIETCITESPPGFREYITSDKICAGYKDGEYRLSISIESYQ